MRIILVGALLGMIAAPLPVQAKDAPAIALARTTQWEMKYNPDSCQLIARFGGDLERMILVITREQPSDYFDLELYGKALSDSGIDVPVELTFGTNGALVKRDGVALTMSGGDKLPVIRITGLRIDGLRDFKNPAAMPVLTPASEAQVTEIAFRKSGGKRYMFLTGSMAAPLAAMRACTTDLVKTWGYDPAVEERLSRHAMPTNGPARWLGTNDFPDKSWMAGHNGIVRFRLDLDSAGFPSGCRVLYRTNPDEFADLSCKLLLQRARFSPALDAAGKPVKSYYINTIRWVASGNW